MASRPAIVGALRRLSGAFPRGGYSYGGDLKDEVVEAWCALFSGEHVTDATLANVVNSCLLNEKAPRPYEIHQAIMGHKRSGNGSEFERQEQGCRDCNHEGIRQIYAVMRRERPNGTFHDRWHTEVCRCTCELGRRLLGGKGPDAKQARTRYEGLMLAPGVQMAGCAWFAMSREGIMEDVRGREVSLADQRRYRAEVLRRRPSDAAPPRPVPMDLEPEATADDQHMAHTRERLEQHLGLEGDELEQAMAAERERLRSRTMVGEGL